MTRRKIKTLKLLADITGYTIGAIASVWMIIKTYAFLRHGGIIFYELNPVISFIELLTSIFGTSFLSYKALKIMFSEKERENYIK